MKSKQREAIDQSVRLIEILQSKDMEVIPERFPGSIHLAELQFLKPVGK